MPVCMAGALQIFVLSVSVHVCACLLWCPCLFMSFMLSSLPFMFCVGVCFYGLQILICIRVRISVFDTFLVITLVKMHQLILHFSQNDFCMIGSNKLMLLTIIVLDKFDPDHDPDFTKETVATTFPFLITNFEVI